jgi:hypothetical protein
MKLLSPTHKDGKAAESSAAVRAPAIHHSLLL